jgi:hypothetical protein
MAMAKEDKKTASVVKGKAFGGSRQIRNGHFKHLILTEINVCFKIR